MNRLDGKTALVTGGSRGIGAAVAKRLAQEGARVALTYVKAADRAEEVAASIHEAGGEAFPILADAADPAAASGAVEAAAERFGGLDILVNNAGTAVVGPLEDYPPDAFDRVFAVNVRAAFVASQAAARLMRDGGRIISIGSVNGDRIPVPGGTLYAASKAALQGLTRGLARDLGVRRITVNLVQPGPVDTDMNPADGPMADRMKSVLALRRYGETAEVAGLVAYLASEEAAFVTGAIYNIDGGFSA